MKKHNFSSGPSILPKEVMAQAAKACVQYKDCGMSILELSHRSAQFSEIIEETESLVREVLGINDDYAVLFLMGGASSQFFSLPMNLINEDETAAYSDTGVWAAKAIKEAKAFCNVKIASSSKAENHTYIPTELDVPADAKYLHITTNNTIFGTQYQWFPEVNVPLVADMSSDIFSRPLPIEKFGVIYAGAQKNLGPSGVTLVIVKKDLLGKVRRHLPTMLDLRTHIADKSLHNTPPTFQIYVCMLTLRWIKAKGGLETIAKMNAAKAKILYDEIDSNPCFRAVARKEDRSLMNVCFVANNPDHEKPFLEICKANGIVDIKGHRSVGGFRASIYNAMPPASIKFLVKLMKDFAKQQGA
jgi:phosphoserine aminotransferase